MCVCVTVFKCFRCREETGRGWGWSKKDTSFTLYVSLCLLNSVLESISLCVSDWQVNCCPLGDFGTTS